MDEKLRRALERIARDKTSGASQLARIACAALRQRFANSPSPRTAELRTAARLLLSAQPEMAPVARLAIECRRAANSAAAFGRFPEVVAAFEAQLTTAPTTIAAHFESLLSGHRSIRVAMFSYSGTAIGAVVRARRRIRGVFCAEGRPNFEGRRAARELSLAGLRQQGWDLGRSLQRSEAPDTRLRSRGFYKASAFRRRWPLFEGSEPGRSYLRSVARRAAARAH